MNEVVKFLTENSVQYLATVGRDGKAKCRPFMFAGEKDGNRRMAGALNIGQSKRHQGLPGLDGLALLHQALKALPGHLHRIHAHVDEQLHAVLGGDAHRVEGVGGLAHGAVKGRVDDLLGGVQAAAGPQNALAEHRVGNLLHLHGRAAEGRADGERRALGGNALRRFGTQQFIKQAHSPTSAQSRSSPLEAMTFL